MLLNEDQYHYIWNWIDNTLHFRPHIYHGHDFFPWKPFAIPTKHAIYGIEFMSTEHVNNMDALINQAFLNVTKDGQRIYDWIGNIPDSFMTPVFLMSNRAYGLKMFDFLVADIMHTFRISTQMVITTFLLMNIYSLDI